MKSSRRVAVAVRRGSKEEGTELSAGGEPGVNGGGVVDAVPGSSGP